MKGFYIEITNNLLDPKHVKAMGSAVWEYMWCLDKMTSVDEDGIGKVLGGKPVKREELQADIGKAVNHIGDNLLKLQAVGYINLKRTPYGNIITVNKAKKRYHQKVSSGSDEKVSSQSEKVSSGRHLKVSNKEDKTVRQDRGQDIHPALAGEALIVVNSFSEVNPSYRQFARDGRERAAASRLIEVHSLELVLERIKVLPQTNSHPYLPTITSPRKLEDRWADLEAGILKQKAKNITSKSNVAFS